MKLQLIQALLICILSLLILPAFGQTGVIRGKVLDGVNRTPLSAASVKIKRLADSAVLARGLSSEKGVIQLDNIPFHDSLELEVSFSGYETFKGVLVIDEALFYMQPILMVPASQVLSEVIVTSAKPLMLIKKDTIEYKASSFTTLPNGKAADLLRRIPGLTIDDQGRLNYNGKRVSRLLVDGKPFFSENGQIALASIPIDLIDKIQISDDVPAEQKDIDPNRTSDSKVVNLSLKKGEKLFGNTWLAGGTDKHYDAGGMVNKSREGSRVSMVGAVNNINKIGTIPPSGTDIIALSGVGGITRTISGTAEVERQLHGGSSFTGNYQFNNPLTTLSSISERRQTILQDSTIISNSTTQNENQSSSHAMMLNLLTPSGFQSANQLNYNTLDIHTVNHFSNMNEKGEKLNELNSNVTSTGKEYTIDSKLAFNLPLKQNKQHLSLSAGLTRIWQDHQDRNRAVSSFFKDGAISSQENINQKIANLRSRTSLTSGLMYVHRLTDHLTLSVDNQFETRWSNGKRKTWNLDTDDKEIGIDSRYTNDFTSRIISNSTAIRLGYTMKDWIVNGGLQGFQNSLFQNNRTDSNSFRKNLFSLSPSLGIARRKGTSYFSIVFMSNNRLPSLEEMQPVPDNTNPLMIQAGNPNLRPETIFSSVASFNKTLSTKTGSNIGSFLSYNRVKNKIVSNIIYDSAGRQFSNYENVNGYWAVNFSLDYSNRIKVGKNYLAITVSSRSELKHDVLYINKELSTVKNLEVGPSMNLAYTRDSTLEAFVNYLPLFNRIDYGHNASASQQYINHQLTGSIGISVWRKIKLMNSLQYAYNSGIAAGFNKASMLWNANVSYLAMHKKMELKASVFDILHQSRSVNRNVGSNYIEDSQSNNLQQYFLLGMVYNFLRVR